MRLVESLRAKCSAAYEKYSDPRALFEITEAELYTRLTSNGSMLIAVAAHTGNHTFPMARNAGKDGLVLAFEPIVDRFKILHANLAAKQFFKVRVFNACCYRKNRILEFVYLPDDPGKSPRHIRKLQSWRREVWDLLREFR